ncbi:MAG: hypothetical protein ACE5KV_01615 [Thermoplasmata archaeon]
MNKKRAVLLATIVLFAALLSFSVIYSISLLLGDSEEDLPQVENLEVAVDSEDNLHIVWEDGRDGEHYVIDGRYLGTRVYYTKFDSDGKRLINDKPITSGGGGYQSIEVDSADNVWVAYRMNGSFLLKLDTEGEKVLERKVLTQIDSSVLVTIGSDDNVYLSWNECWQLNCFRYYMALNSDGDILTDSTNVTLVTPISGFPVVLDDNGKYVYLGKAGVTDSEGNIHIVQTQGSMGYRNLFYTKINSSAEVEIDNIQVTSDGIWEWNLKVDIDSSNNVHVAAEAGIGLGYVKLDNMGNVLRKTTGIRSEDSRDDPDSPDVDSDSSGNAYIVWHVSEVISYPYPHSGIERYAYYSYCAKIDSQGGSFHEPWLVAKSKTSESDLSQQLVANILVVIALVMLIVTVVLFWRTRPKMQESQNSLENEDR